MNQILFGQAIIPEQNLFPPTIWMSKLPYDLNQRLQIREKYDLWTLNITLLEYCSNTIVSIKQQYILVSIKHSPCDQAIITVQKT